MKKETSRKEKFEAALKILKEIKPNKKEAEQIRRFVQPLNNILYEIEAEKRQKKIDSIKKPILDILLESPNNALRHILISSRLIKKLGTDVVKHDEVMSALYQLKEERHIKCHDDLVFSLVG